MINENEVILSVYVATYNHEKYIVRALDSILMQKTKYNFEVLVGEDCSTDSTRAVLKEYEKQHPDKFTIFYREKNMHNTSCNNARDLKQRCRGKYIIALEGDDFWTDEYKIEKQISFLENHPEYIAVAHRCVVVDEDSNPNGETYPQCLDSEYTFKHFFSELMPGQLATVMYRNYMKDASFDASLVSKGLTPGDRLLYFSLLCHGRIYCFDETMSAYRHITNHGTSFSATHTFNYERQTAWQKELILYANKHCTKAEIKIAEYQYLYLIPWGLKTKQINIKRAVKDFCSLKYGVSAVFIGIKRFINKKILHKTLYT